MCDHEFELDEDWRENIELDNCLRVPITCNLCGLKAHETFTDSLFTDKNTGEEI